MFDINGKVINLINFMIAVDQALCLFLSGNDV